MLNYCRLAEIEYDASTEGDIKVLNFKGGLIEAVDYKFSMFINFLSRKPTDKNCRLLKTINLPLIYVKMDQTV